MLKSICTIPSLQLENVITQMVPHEHAGFMKGCDIYQNIHHCQTYHTDRIFAVGIFLESIQFHDV